MEKALLVIDIQNDYLWEKRKNKFTYDTEKIIKSINKTIDKYKKDHDIIYISHLINNFPTNKLLFGFSIKGTEGAELYSKLNIVSNLKFDKYFSDAYKSKKFRNYMKKQNYTTAAMTNCTYTASDEWAKEIDTYIVLLKQYMTHQQYNLLVDSQNKWKEYEKAESKLLAETVGTFVGTMYIPTLAGMQEDIVEKRAKNLSSLYYYMSDENIMRN